MSSTADGPLDQTPRAQCACVLFWIINLSYTYLALIGNAFLFVVLLHIEGVNLDSTAYVCVRD